MITIIFGRPGRGKTSLLTHFLIQTYRENGRKLLKFAAQCVTAANRTRTTPLTVPDAPPIFANYQVKIKTGYQKYYEPYYLNGFYFGLQNEKMPTQRILPGGKIFFTEAQRYYNSRKSQTFPEHVINAFAEHRQYYLDIFLDSQRFMNIDKSIRDLADRFLEVQGMKNVYDKNGWLVRSEFDCREFASPGDVELYLDGKEKTWQEVHFTHEGNLFQNFDSYGCFDDYLPPDGQDFDCMPYLTMSQVKELSAAHAVFYNNKEPKEYRGK